MKSPARRALLFSLILLAMAILPNGVSGILKTVSPAEADQPIVNAPVSGAASVTLTEVGAIRDGTAAYDVTANATHAFLVTAQFGLRVIDISDPADLKEVGTYQANARPGFGMNAVVYQDGFAYVAALNSGLLVIDVREPSRPALAGQLLTQGTADDLAIDGDIVYLVTQYTDLVAIDVSDPTQPVELDRIQPENPRSIFTAITLAGNLALAGDHMNGVRIYDIQDPRALQPVGIIAGRGTADVIVREGVAFLSLQSRGVLSYDLANAAAPSLIDQELLPGAVTELAIENGLLFAGVREYEEGSLPGVYAFEIDEGRIVRFASHALSEARRMDATGDRLYVADVNTGLHIFTIEQNVQATPSAPPTPLEPGSATSTRRPVPTDMATPTPHVGLGIYLPIARRENQP